MRGVGGRVHVSLSGIVFGSLRDNLCFLRSLALLLGSSGAAASPSSAADALYFRVQPSGEPQRQPAPAVHDVVIIGAGPGGLQWALLLEDTPLTYVVLERAPRVVPFFRTYPRARRLISHNKCTPGASMADDWRLRHDWHSLLGARLGMCNVTREYYPHADDLVRYFERAASGLRIAFGVDVTGVEYARRDHTEGADAHHAVRDAAGRAWLGRHVVIATGLQPLPPPPFLRDLEAERKPPGYPPLGVYDYGSFPGLSAPAAPWCDNKRVAVIGVGNAGLEVANLLKACAHVVTMVARSAAKIAALTHYPGHVRLQALGLIDRFYLKTVDTYVPGDTIQNYPGQPRDFLDAHADVVIFCGGFTAARPGLVSDVDSAVAKAKYPRTDPFYAIRNHSRAWYAGALMHSADWGRSAGGFIHGFRYLVRAQFRWMRSQDAQPHASAWPSVELRSIDALAAHVTRRIQTSSGLYQMQGALCDVIAYSSSGAYLYWEEVPRQWVGEILASVAPPAAAEGSPGGGVASTWVRSCRLYFSYALPPPTDEPHSRVEFADLFEGALAGRKPDPFFLHPVLEGWRAPSGGDGGAAGARLAALRRARDGQAERGSAPGGGRGAAEGGGAAGEWELRGVSNVDEDLETEWREEPLLAEIDAAVRAQC